MKKTLLFLSFAILSLASCTNDNKITNPPKPSVGGVIQPNVGGANEPNQVYVDLSKGKSTVISRDSWDFGFSSGTDFRVIINGSLKMAVKKLATSDMALPQVVDANVAVGEGKTPSSTGYVDNPTGVLIGTAIAEVAAKAEDNKVYLVNMGFAISKTTPTAGSVSLDGEARGWKKVRILREGTGYKIQYADLASTTFTEKIITKDNNFNFSFFNLASGKTLTVEPYKKQWDLNFTTFTNYLPGNPELIYGDSDFVLTNRIGGIQAYQVLVAEGGSYADFTKAKVVESKFNASAADQRIIGANWRTGGLITTTQSVKTDRFYVLKDGGGNYYKLKFQALANDKGVRGYPSFEYALLQ